MKKSGETCGTPKRGKLEFDELTRNESFLMFQINVQGLGNNVGDLTLFLDNHFNLH